MKEKDLSVEEQLNHDLRGILSPIYAYLDLLIETNLDEEQVKLVDKIKKSTQTVLNVINGEHRNTVLRSEAAGKGVLNKKSVLLIEDDELSRTALAAMFRSWGMACDSLENISDAEDIISKNNYDFIITDYFHKNTHQNSLDFILNLKKRIGHKINKCVLVMISGSDSVLQRSQGAVDLCILKPLDPGSFYERLVDNLKKTENQIVDQQRIEHYQKTQLLDRLVAIFEADVPKQIVGLRQSVNSRDLEKIKYYSHCLYSKAKTLGVLKMSDHCFELESIIANGQMDDIFSLVEKIEFNYNEALDYIKINYNLL